MTEDEKQELSDGISEFMHWAHDDLAMYVDNLNYAHGVEERIAELGLQVEYVNRLFSLVHGIEYVQASTMSGPVSTLWRLVHASAADRCKAALECVRNKS